VVHDKKHYFPYLQTTPDNIKKNNLYGLPPCIEKDGEPLPPWEEGEDIEGGGEVDPTPGGDVDTGGDQIRLYIIRKPGRNPRLASCQDTLACTGRLLHEMRCQKSVRRLSTALLASSTLSLRQSARNSSSPP